MFHTRNMISRTENCVISQLSTALVVSFSLSLSGGHECGRSFWCWKEKLQNVLVFLFVFFMYSVLDVGGLCHRKWDQYYLPFLVLQKRQQDVFSHGNCI